MCYFVQKNLVIVESPSKSKTIEKYLGEDYKVVSSKGHIRDLATSGSFGLGVDIENGFTPTYVPLSLKKKTITELKKEVKNSKMIYLATDPDREGEAISWHLKDALGIKENQYQRVLFHEITKEKVLEAMQHPTKIDENLVRSQETRRILDRIIGFRLSKLLQSKIGAKSAGRVQSVALKLIVDREREIASFIPEEYWSITGIFEEFEANLFAHHHKDIKIHTQEEVNAILKELDLTFSVDTVEEKQKKKKSRPPFITSTLQQEASTRLSFSAKKTMSLAQTLYEGVELGEETVGLITYMRTDSIRLSDQFTKEARSYIQKEYGKEYVGYIKTSKKTENVQDAHEAIRPTSLLRTPLSVKPYLSEDAYKLYKFIYTRALASLMADAKVNQTTIVLDNHDYQFKATGQTLVFDGYLKLYKDYETSEETILPNVEKGKIYQALEIQNEQHFTKPPARYTEAKLIKEMEELGIGRPSTYAKTIDTLKERSYVVMEEKKFKPTEVGIESTDKLQEFFADLINVDYTREMEEDLDKIAEGELVWNEVLKDFYELFEPRVKTAFQDMEKKAPEQTGELCPECGNPLVIRKGRYGSFTACSNYPECKYVKKEEKKQIVVMDCPECDGKVLERKTKRGKIFYGCSNFPKCKFASWDKPLEKTCPKCGKYLVEKNGVIQCSSCDYVEGK